MCECFSRGGFAVDQRLKRLDCCREIFRCEVRTGKYVKGLRVTWIKTENFLEIKIEGTPRRLDGKYRPVATYLHDYRAVNGLMMPYLLETVVEGYKDKEQIQIESIVSNPKLDQSRFAIPR